MIKNGIDQDALIAMFAQASVQGGEQLRQAVSQAMLKALQGRELTLRNMRGAVQAVTQAATTGAAQNKLPLPDVEQLLAKAFAGMDGALLQAVEANRRALQQLAQQGAGMTTQPMQAALGQLEQMEDMFFGAVEKAAGAAGGPMAGPWQHVLEGMRAKGTDSGAQASATVQGMMAQARSAMRDSRTSGMKATQALMDSYSALVSGVLIGMSEALQAAPAPAPSSDEIPPPPPPPPPPVPKARSGSR